MQDGRISITDMDITANLPYVDGVYIAFDHHISEVSRVISPPNHIVYPNSPSAARVVYEYYGAEERFKNIPAPLMEAVDVADSAQYTMDQIMNPTGWILLAFVMDARTGLGRFKNFRITNYALMMKLVDLCRTHSVEEILQDEDVKERVNLYFEHKDKFIEQLKDARGFTKLLPTFICATKKPFMPATGLWFTRCIRKSTSPSMKSGERTNATSSLRPANLSLTGHQR